MKAIFASLSGCVLLGLDDMSMYKYNASFLNILLSFYKLSCVMLLNVIFFPFRMPTHSDREPGFLPCEEGCKIQSCQGYNPTQTLHSPPPPPPPHFYLVVLFHLAFN